MSGKPGKRAKPIGPWRVVRAQFKELWRLASIRPTAPPALLLRVGRWFVAVGLREFAWQLSVAGLVILIGLALSVLDSTAGKIVFGLVALFTSNELRLAWDSRRSAAEVERALEGLEPEPGPRMPRSHIALPLLMFAARGVERRRGLIFDDSTGKRLRLDLYRQSGRRRAREPRPAVIQVHGGGWLAGSRLEQGIPLLNHLAQTGWVGFNIDYRLSPQATWPDHIVDVKRAIAWVRSNHADLGIDPERICVTGGSAGGHLTALAGLTENDPEFQPGFEDEDTSVSVAVPFYGVYDLTDADGVYYPQLGSWVFEQIVVKRKLADEPELYRAASPRFRIHQDAPPFLVIHGERDTLAPVADARTFTAELSEVSANPVRYVELPGAEHAFDLLPSLRTARCVEGIERFLRATLQPRVGARAPARRGGTLVS